MKRDTKVIIRALTLIFPVLIAPSVGAQSLKEIDKREASVIEAWRATPLTIRRAVFVSSQPEAFDNYQPRKSNTFKPGEKLVAYVEPVGFDWKEGEDGLLEFGFSVDFLIKGSDGKIIGGQDNFATVTKHSRSRMREFFLTLTMNVTGASPGDYILEYKLRDVASDKSAVTDLPFTISD
jgi:hypothetical protein